jgi:enterochelin esterase family protein
MILPAVLTGNKFRGGTSMARRIFMRISELLAVLTIGLFAITAYGGPFPTDPGDNHAGLSSPEVSADRKVTFRFYSPNAKVVALGGDFSAEGTTLPMTKGADGVWTLTTDAVAPGLYGYFFKVEGVRTPDPGNLFISTGAAHLKSYVEVPGDTPGFWAVKDVPHGQLHELLYKSQSIGTIRRIIVYTPPGYDPAGTKTYPVMYLLHGATDNESYWITAGRANYIMDNLLADGKAKPAIFVSCFGHTSIPPGPEAGPNGELYDVTKIGNDIVHDIIPLVDKEFRTGHQSKDRGISGIAAMGAYQSLMIGLNNPDKFAYVAGFSAGFRRGQDMETLFKGLLADPDKTNANFKLIRLGGGSAEMGSVNTAKPLDQLLTAKGIKHDFMVFPGGTHTWNSWRGYFRDMMSEIFTDSN